MKLARGLILAGVMMLSAGAAFAEDPVGRWKGLLATPDGEFPVGVTITKGADGKLSAVAESPKQTPDAIPVDTVTSDGKALAFASSAASGAYDGVWNDDLKSWTGHWTQTDGKSFPLVLIRAQ